MGKNKSNRATLYSMLRMYEKGSIIEKEKNKLQYREHVQIENTIKHTRSHIICPSPLQK